jgi:hypothetical protein
MARNLPTLVPTLFPTLAALAAALALGACDQSAGSASNKAAAVDARSLPAQYTDALAKKANALFNDTIQSRAGAAGDRAANLARGEATNSTYEQLTGDRDCGEDCNGHDAGYAWARLHKAEDPNSCPNDKGDNFEDGCRAYGEHIQAARSEAKGDVLNGKDPPS